MIYDISWPYVTADSFKDTKKSSKKHPKKSKKIKKREPWSDPYSDFQYIYKNHKTPPKKSSKR